MFSNDRKRINFTNSLLFSLSGSPVVRFGDEIGMGDNLSPEGRASARTTMQWSGKKNANFSGAEEEKLLRPLIKEGEYSYKK